MLNVIRYSQMVDLVAIDGATSDYLGPIQDVWVNDDGRISYLSSPKGYIPLLQVSGISAQAVSVRARPEEMAKAPTHALHRLQKLPVLGAPDASEADATGWVEDFLFDWQTGEVTHYILAGKIAEPLGKRAVLGADGVKTITVEAVVLEENVRGRLSSEAEGLKGFLSEKQHQVRQLVHELSDRLNEQILPNDTPKTVHIKIKQAEADMAAANHPNHHLLTEATDFLHDHWESLQQSAHRANSRAKAALASTWKQLSIRP